ncbi:MAG: hypothetical protein SH850_27795 [Planctomycetaceae bacterium]|nr:hypothetical protein [Planctomycetaceae bacterium]
MIHARFALVLMTVGLLLAGSIHAQDADPPRLPIGQKGVDYLSPATSDPVARLIADVEAGKTTLAHNESTGYLPALLAALDVPVESQLLLFSRTSLQSRHIGPKTPRAIYFTDEVTIGWIPDAPIIEVMGQDPVKGSVFYTIPQTADAFQPRRESQRCNGCHVTQRSAGVPGFIVRSFETDARGGPVSGKARITHASPVVDRWGGWFLTGQTPKQSHRANLIGPGDFEQHTAEPLHRGALADLSSLTDLARYPSRHSDVNAALVFDHYGDTYNVLMRVNAEQRLDKPLKGMDGLVTALLLLDEAPLVGPITGIGGFAEQYLEQGPRDAQERSLRELDLDTRVYKWGVSPLVYSQTFRELPDPARREVQTRMTALLDGSVPWTGPERSEDVRRTALEILRETLLDWPR